MKPDHMQEGEAAIADEAAIDAFERQKQSVARIMRNNRKKYGEAVKVLVDEIPEPNIKLLVGVTILQKGVDHLIEWGAFTSHPVVADELGEISLRLHALAERIHDDFEFDPSER